jgi:hypothetical protein
MMRAAQGNPRLAIEFAGSPPQSRGLPLVAASARAEVASIRHSLSPSEFDTLLACSVLGESFSDAAVAPVAGRSCDAVADALQHACALGVLLEDPGDSGRLCFRHAAVRNVLYASLVSLKRRILHERATRSPPVATHNRSGGIGKSSAIANAPQSASAAPPTSSLRLQRSRRPRTSTNEPQCICRSDRMSGCGRNGSS